MPERDEPTEEIPLARPDVGPDEERAVLEVLRSGVLSLGPRAGEFEELVSRWAGTPWAVAVSSGTSGLHLAVRAARVGPGDCVPTVSFSFVASANCLRYEGAEPVFLDVDPDTLTMDPTGLKTYLESCRRTDASGSLHDPVTGRRVAAVLPVHCFGHPPHLDPILDAVEPYDIPVIEDAAEALGSSYRRADGTTVAAGSVGRFGVFAFYPNKQITTGEGGMVVGSRPGDEERIRAETNQGRNPRSAWLEHPRMGFNYRLDELSAAMGVVQMRRLDEILRRRAGVAAAYARALADVEELRLPVSAPWADTAWFVYVVRVADPSIDRDAVVRFLVDRGVQSKPYFFPAIHEQGPYEGRDDLIPAPLVHTDEAAAAAIALPFFSTMTDRQVDRVVATLTDALASPGCRR